MVYDIEDPEDVVASPSLSETDVVGVELLEISGAPDDVGDEV